MGCLPTNITYTLAFPMILSAARSGQQASPTNAFTMPHDSPDPSDERKPSPGSRNQALLHTLAAVIGRIGPIQNDQDNIFVSVGCLPRNITYTLAFPMIPSQRKCRQATA